MLDLCDCGCVAHRSSGVCMPSEYVWYIFCMSCVTCHIFSSGQGSGSGHEFRDQSDDGSGKSGQIVWVWVGVGV